MKSPFPGMDPYLEPFWGDIHSRLVIYACDRLQTRIPRDLKCRVQERVFLESVEGAGRSMHPDIRVLERASPAAPGPSTGGVQTAEPLILELQDEEITETFIEIIDAASGNRVITVVEFLSLSNKSSGEGRDKYLQKQKELRDGAASLVEIDLLRAGDWVLSAPKPLVPKPLRAPYRACVRRGWKPHKVELYHFPLRERLPAIRVPLRESDTDAPLELQPLVEQCYELGRYDDTDYSQPADPTLASEDAVWADALLRAAGRRN